MYSQCSGTVSYTHLDVYKRQIHDKINVINMEFSRTFCSPISYFVSKQKKTMVRLF